MKYYEELQSLTGFRGTKRQIIAKISTITNYPVKTLEPFCEEIPGNDNGFCFNAGMDGDAYLDFDLYMLKTNARDHGKRVWYITEINKSY